MRRAPTLTDGIVVLDELTLNDVADHLAGEDEEQARRFGWFPKRSTEQTVRAAILEWRENWRRAGSTRTFATRDAATHELLGGCQLRLGSGEARVSYWTFPAARRRGVAARALRLLCEYAFGEVGVAEIVAHVEPDNVASCGVVRSAGFVERARNATDAVYVLTIDAFALRE